MATILRKIATSMSFRQQLTLAFTLGIVGLALVTSVVISVITQQRLHTQLVEQGQTVTENFAQQSALPLLFLSEESARDAANSMFSFPNVVGVAILTTKNEVLYQRGEIIEPPKKNVTGERSFQLEDEQAWYFSLPVFAGETTGEDNIDVESIIFSDEPAAKEFIGSVRVKFSKAALQTITHDLLRSTSLATALAAAILLLILLMITSRLTRPIKTLSETMRQAQEGEAGVRAQLSGSKDVINMEKAFNSMMSQLEEREAELKRARDTALASARIKGQFATTVSHELRTPMNGVMGMLELLHSMNLNAEQLEYVNIARSSGEDLLVLIDDILDFSQIESGKLKLHKSNFDPREMVRSIVELLSPQAQQKHLQITYGVDDEVPQWLTGDTGRIRQVLVNMVGNAIKFTHEGSVTLHVTVIDSKNGKQPQLRYTVQDTGIGIEQGAQQRVFEAFSQVDGSTTRQFGGTGLGLAICSQLVELMGGKIGVKSELGKGSTFWITLPMEPGKEDSPSDQYPHLQFSAMRILIVSRTPESCRSLVNKFIQLQCFQRNTTSAEEAITMLRSARTQGKPYNVLIVDAPLGNSDEKELLQQIQNDSLTKDTRILVLAHRRPEHLPAEVECIEKSPSTELLQVTLLRMVDRDSYWNQEADNGQRGHILIVEDNATHQLITQGMVEKLGYTCSIANNGSEAIDLLESMSFDLILMDCQMPVMNGYTASQLIRGKNSAYKKLPIIALTANLNSSEIDRCFTAGMNDYLSKPITLEKLKPKIDTWLQKNIATANTDQAQVVTGSLHANTAVKPEGVVDMGVLSTLRTQIEASFVKLVEAYIADTPVYIRNLVTALHNKSVSDIKYFAQLIKDSSSNLGATRLANDCKAIEDICASREFDKAEAIIGNITREFSEVELALIQQIGSQQSKKDGLSFPPHVLIADDDQSARIVMRGILEKQGYKISEAESGLEALDFCRHKMPDLILMDALMPEMDGFIASEKIMAIDNASRPIILMITNLQDEGTLERAFSAGATDFISKPINIKVLQQRVSRALQTKHVDRHIHHLSYYDSLTTLPNRTFFVERSKNLIKSAEMHNTRLAIMFMDLDRFKLVNDSQGHESGDRLLKAFAKRLQSNVRSADIVARLGGDEFTVVLSDIRSRKDAGKVADKILRSFSEPFNFMSQQVHISSSIGIAVYPDNGKTISELMKQADTAMFQAKAKGGDCYLFYEQGMECEVTRQIELEREIREALEQDQFVLHYQPQVDMKDGKLVGLEALIRWHHPQKGTLPPGEFIPWAEKSGLIANIGNWVLNRACQQLHEWLSQDITPVPIAINVSGGELADSVLYKKVARALADNNVPAELLKLEITEDTLVGGDKLTTQHLTELRSLGTTLAIDDFGTGYSSLSYLKMFPVDTLKIDRSFVKDLPGDSNSSAIIAGIIALGHSLKLKVVAEGVETEEQKTFLKQEGCDIAQGYLISKPLSAEDLQAWILEEQDQGGHLWRTNNITKAPHQTQRPL